MSTINPSVLLNIERDHETESIVHKMISKNIEERRKEGLIIPPVNLEPEIERDYLGVSAVGMPSCALWYQLQGAKQEPIDVASQVGFDTGHVFEAYAMALLGAVQQQDEIIIPFFGAPGDVIRGHCDGVVVLPNGEALAECKTTGGYSFGMKQKLGADSAHIEQAFVYAVMKKLELFFIIYVNREAKKNSDIIYVEAYRIHDLRRARYAVDVLLDERFTAPLSGKLVYQSIPASEFGPNGWRCRPDKEIRTRNGMKKVVGYCPYRHVCGKALEYREEMDG